MLELLLVIFAFMRMPISIDSQVDGGRRKKNSIDLTDNRCPSPKFKTAHKNAQPDLSNAHVDSVSTRLGNLFEKKLDLGRKRDQEPRRKSPSPKTWQWSSWGTVYAARS